jgi:hypothetical protein
MKKRTIILGIITLLASSTMVAYAGTLNEYETTVISVARGQFVYNGVTYQAEEQYVEELSAYLMQDGIELTVEQRDYAIESIYANVEQGVLEGYLQPVVASEEEEQPTENSGEEQPETEQPDTEDDEDSADSNLEDKTKEYVEDIIKQPSTITKIDNNQGKVTVTDKTSKELLTVNTVIKNTGFNLNTTVIMGIGLLLIMLTCFMVTMKYQLLAHKDKR